jgi:hypothetical protein
MRAGEVLPASSVTRIAPFVWSKKAPDVGFPTLADLIKALGSRTPKFWAVLRMN